mgnify:CR=1 FL=1
MTEYAIERRKDYQQLGKDIAILKTDVGYIKSSIEKLEGVKDRLVVVENVKEDLKNHATHDRWLFTTIIGMLLAIFVKLFVQ